MLSIAAMSGGQASYYLNLAREDYYLKGGEPPGQWFGLGSSKLGLTGTIEDSQLYNLFKGANPDGSHNLVQIQKHDGRAEHRPGWDFTFSAPKSLSALWSQATPEQRLELQAAHLKAVKTALGYVQDVASFARRGREGRVLTKAELIIALFEHSTSRALDPQLHTHALVMNIGLGEDGRYSTLNSPFFFDAKMTVGALYRVQLAFELQRMGIECERENSWFEVKGVPKSLTDEFSKRREQIVAELDRLGLKGAKASSLSALETREAKESVSRFALFQDWLLEGTKQGWSTSEAVKLFGKPVKIGDMATELYASATLAIENLLRDQAHFKEVEFVRFMAQHGQCRGFDVDTLRRAAEEFLTKSQDIVRLGSHFGHNRFTTRAMFELEEKLFGDASRLQSDKRHEISADVVVSVLSRPHTLSLEQTRAVWHITAETGGLALVSGMAGAGKTTMLKAAKEAWEQGGKKVIGATLGANVAGVLQEESGIPSSSIAKLLSDIERGRVKLSRDHVLVIDEAGMVATHAMARLVELCLNFGTKLVLIGDEKQLQPIGPGAPFREFRYRFESTELREIRRQNEEWARQAASDFAFGNAEEALFAFAQRGLVKVHETTDEAMLALIEEWASDPMMPNQKLILAGYREDVALLNALAQQSLISKGVLSGASVKVGNDDMLVGDRVMFTANHSTMGVKNGEMGQVTRLDLNRNLASVELDSGERVSFPIDAFGDIQLGYASTTHKKQGATTECSYVLVGGPMQDREMTYVQASRARRKTSLHVTAKEAGDELERLVYEMERSRQKEMAHSFVQIPKVDFGIDL